jgi:hypothetical protein
MVTILGIGSIIFTNATITSRVRTTTGRQLTMIHLMLLSFPTCHGLSFGVAVLLMYIAFCYGSIKKWVTDQIIIQSRKDRWLAIKA